MRTRSTSNLTILTAVSFVRFRRPHHSVDQASGDTSDGHLDAQTHCMCQGTRLSPLERASKPVECLLPGLKGESKGVAGEERYRQNSLSPHLFRKSGTPSYFVHGAVDGATAGVAIQGSAVENRRMIRSSCGVARIVALWRCAACLPTLPDATHWSRRKPNHFMRQAATQSALFARSMTNISLGTAGGIMWKPWATVRAAHARFKA